MHQENTARAPGGLRSRVMPPGKQQACPGRVPCPKQLHISRVIQMSPPTGESGNNGIPVSHSLPFFRGGSVGIKGLTA